jgi:dihydroflavonol-4-reductase
MGTRAATAGTGNGAPRPKLALVTGASGFIGSQLVRVLLSEGVKVRALVQAGVPLQNLHGLPVEQIQGDLLDPHSLARALEGCDTLFHLAAIFAYWLRDPSLMYRVNVEGTIKLFDAALLAKVKRVVHTSSIAALGTLPGEEAADETTVFNNWDTADHYILSKYVSELEALKFNARGLPVVVVNPTFPFGTNDIVPTPTGLLIQRYMSGQNPFVFKGGFNMANVKDIARGHWLAALKGRPNERYILGGHNVTYRDFATKVCELAGVKPPRWQVPTAPFARVGRVMEWVSDNITHKPPLIVGPLMVEKRLRYSTERFLYCDIAKARRELGYEPGPWEEALAEAVEWFAKGRNDRLAGKQAAEPLDAVRS